MGGGISARRRLLGVISVSGKRRGRVLNFVVRIPGFALGDVLGRGAMDEILAESPLMCDDIVAIGDLEESPGV